MATVKKIIVETIYKSTGLGNFVTGITQQTFGLRNMSKQLGISTAELRLNAEAMGENVNKMGLARQAYGKWGSTIKGVGTVLKTGLNIYWGAAKAVFHIGQRIYGLVKRLAHFRAEWLSVMFISMMVSATLMGIVNSVLQTTGVFEIFRITLIALMLPVMMPLIEIMMEILQWFLDLPPNVQELIAWIILLGAAFTTSIVFLSQAALLMSSLGLSMGSLLVLLAPFAAAIGASAVAVALFGDEAEGMADSLIEMIEGGVDMAVDFINQFTNTFTQNLPLITQIASDVMEALLDGLYKILTALSPFVLSFMNALKTVWEERKQDVYDIVSILIDGFITFFFMFLPDLIDLGGMLLTKLLEGFRKNKELISSSINEVVGLIGEFLVELSPQIVELGKTVLQILLEGFKENHELISNAIKEILPVLQDAIIEVTPEIVNVGFSIAFALVEGILKYFEDNALIIVGAIIGAIIGGFAGIPGIGAVIGGMAGAGWQQMLDQLFGTTKKDFVFRPGQAPMAFSPDDTIIGAKGKSLEGIGGGGMSYSPTYYVTVSDKSEFEKMLDEHDRKLVDEMRRMQKI